MKLIDLIVKEVKREDIPDNVKFITQDNDDRSLWGFSDSPSLNQDECGSYWSLGDQGNSGNEIKLSNDAGILAENSLTEIITIRKLLTAYDAAEKPAEPEKLVDDDSFGQSERYNRGNIECIDIIREMVSDKSGEEAFCVGNITKYLYRYKSKGGLKDVIKARNYLNQMIKGMGDE